ncbi:MAG: hypothetical protein DRH56_06050 [Deltaproteobacteria bacterium]|nr:MAG: hypothetical protein DRH56_06050 [Deltaproteobacteria bacterium]
MKNAMRIDRQRRGLLAKVHIAVKDLCIDDGTYRDILRREFGVASAAALSNRELESLIRYFRGKGWEPKRAKDAKKPDRAGALRERAQGLAGEMDMSETRFRGLCRRICGTDRLEWCRDAAALKRLLAVMGKINRQQ